MLIPLFLLSSMYRDPDEVETKQPAVKTDPTAPARSAIRRQRTVRYSPNTRQPSFHTISSTSYRPGSSHGWTRAPLDRRSLLEDIRRREGAPTSPSQHTATEVANLEAALREYSSARAADVAHSRASLRSRSENGRAFLRDPLSYERPNERVRIGRDTTVPEAPETIRARQRGPEDETGGAVGQLEEVVRRDPGHDHWPTPPYSSGESSESSPAHRSIPPLDNAPFTPRFAPAHRLSNEAAGEIIVGSQTFATRQNSLALLAERIPSPSEALNDEDHAFLTTLAVQLQAMRNRTPSMLTAPYLADEAAFLRSIETRLNLLSVNGTGETTSNSVEDPQTLRRLAQQHEDAFRRVQRQFRRSRRAHARQRQDMLDGLGDRQRSFSPDDDTWETMLTTITPDERVPSAHSSFTTATASASASAASRSSATSAASSYGTLVTVPSTYTDIEACPLADESSLSDNNDNDNDIIFDLIEEDWSTGSTASRERILADTRSQVQMEEEMLSRRLARQHRSQNEVQAQAHARRARNRARDEELRRLESSVHRLERQLAEERAGAGRQRPEERL